MYLSNLNKRQISQQLYKEYIISVYTEIIETKLRIKNLTEHYIYESVDNLRNEYVYLSGKS